VSDPVSPTERHEPGGPLFWSGAAVGLAVVVFATVNLVSASSGPRLRSVATFVLGAGVVHDALWAPAAVAIGAATLVAPRWTRTPLRVGLALSALLLLFTWPEVRGYGRRPRNPSVLPLDYGPNLVAVLAVIWLGVAGVVAARAWRRRSAS
jgi:hypothetical protein